MQLTLQSGCSPFSTRGDGREKACISCHKHESLSLNDIIFNKYWSLFVNCFVYEESKNVHPRTGYEDPEGKYMYSSTLSLTSALDGSGWLTPRPGRFTPGKEMWYPLCRKLS